MKTFLALGDSYTIGEGVSEFERWPAMLTARLRADGVQLDNPRIIARTGWTTDELFSAVDREHLTERFDLVTLLAGVNDQFRGLGTANYRRSFDGLLQRALKLAKPASHLIVLSIPDWSVTPFAAGRDRARI